MFRVRGLFVRVRYRTFTPCWRCGSPEVNGIFCEPCRKLYIDYTDGEHWGVDEIFDTMRGWFGDFKLRWPNRDTISQR